MTLIYDEYYDIECREVKSYSLADECLTIGRRIARNLQPEAATSGVIVHSRPTTVMENQLTSQLKIRVEPEEYLRLERMAEGKSEYLDGEMLPMPGASRVLRMGMWTPCSIRY